MCSKWRWLTLSFCSVKQSCCGAVDCDTSSLLLVCSAGSHSALIRTPARRTGCSTVSTGTATGRGVLTSSDSVVIDQTSPSSWSTVIIPPMPFQRRAVTGVQRWWRRRFSNDDDDVSACIALITRCLADNYAATSVMSCVPCFDRPTYFQIINNFIDSHRSVTIKMWPSDRPSSVSANTCL